MLFYKAPSLKSAPRRGGLSLTLGTDDADATVKFQSQTFKVARFCVRKKGEETDVADAELDLPRERFRRIGADSGSHSRQAVAETDMDAGGEAGKNASSTGIPESEPGPRPEMSPAPDSPRLSVQLASPRVPSERHPHLESSFDKACEPSRVPRAAETHCDGMAWGQLHDQSSQRGFRKKESKAVLMAR